jgi:predicted nucleic acid-binding Zn finger protein
MEISKEDGIFRVQGSRNNIYEVNLKNNTCTCPHFRFRLKAGSDCKHIRACKELAAGTAGSFDAIVAYVRDNVFVESVEVIEKFGEEAVESMLGQGELIEESGKVRLL